MGLRATLLARGDTKSLIEFAETAGTTAVDIAGAGADGTYEGGFTLDSKPGPLFDEPQGMVLLNGTTGRVRFPDHADRDLGDGPFTINGFFALTAAGGSEQLIFDRGEAGTPGIAYNVGGVANKIGIVSSGVAVICTATVDVTDLGVHMFTWKKNGAANKILVDGVDRTGTVTNQTLINTAADMLFGEYNGSGLNFGGKLGVWSLHNAEVTDADIAGWWAEARSPRREHRDTHLTLQAVRRAATW